MTNKTDFDKVASEFQTVLAAVSNEGVSTDTLIEVEYALQSAWCEVNDGVDSLEDVEAIYPDD